ncbi:MAG: hypothetical protein J7L25_00915 [Deltaproteobacteria bacterium]|nr:hypothetical protein [Candidatus Tharpella aukensis]
MKKTYFVIFWVLFCFGLLISDVAALPLESVFVTSDVCEYDQNDFPGIDRECRVLIGAKTYVEGELVSVDSVPTNNVFLPYGMPGWDMWMGIFKSPPDGSYPSIGSDWATQYIFYTAKGSTLLNLEGCTFRELEIPQNVLISGNTISWDTVAGATYYKLRWFYYNNGSKPNMSAPVAETGYLTSPTYTVTDLPAGDYALRVEAFEFSGVNPVNKSNFFVRYRHAPLMFKIGTIHDAFNSINDRYKILSYFMADSDFSPASGVATIEWGGNSSTYVWIPAFRRVHENYDRYMVAVLYPNQSTPINLTSLENIPYVFTQSSGGNTGIFETVTPVSSFDWLEIPCVDYDHNNRTVSWTSIGDDVYYKVRIYPSLLDGTPNLNEPLYDKMISPSETSFVFPYAAPTSPGYFVAVQAMKFSSLSEYVVNFSRDFVRIPVVYTFGGKVVIQGN